MLLQFLKSNIDRSVQVADIHIIEQLQLLPSY
jgi:hypothetical protein